MSQPQQESNSSGSPQNNANLALFLMQTWATSIEVFIRANFGARYLGLQAAAVLVLVPAYFVFKKARDTEMLCLYLFTYLFLCFVHQQTIRRRVRLGVHLHSYYDGTSIFSKVLPKCSELTLKRWIEPFCVMGFGALLIPASEATGLYLIIGGACMCFSTGICCIQQEVRLLDLNDSVLDQQALAERLRDMRGDRH